MGIVQDIFESSFWICPSEYFVAKVNTVKAHTVIRLLLLQGPHQSSHLSLCQHFASSRLGSSILSCIMHASTRMPIRADMSSWKITLRIHIKVQSLIMKKIEMIHYNTISPICVFSLIFCELMFIHSCTFIW